MFGHEFLNDSDRAIPYNNSSPVLYEEKLSGWHRYVGEAVNQMPKPVSKSIAVAQRAQDGSTAHIVQWQMGQYRPRCAFMVPLAAVNGMLTLPFQILT